MELCTKDDQAVGWTLCAQMQSSPAKSASSRDYSVRENLIAVPLEVDKKTQGHKDTHNGCDHLCGSLLSDYVTCLFSCPCSAQCTV